MVRRWLMPVFVVMLLPACGGSGGRALGSAVARAAVNVAVAAVAAAASSRSRRRRSRNEDDWPAEPPGLVVSEPFEVFEYDVLTGSEREPLPLDRSVSVIEIDPEHITCDVDTECAVLVVNCCACAEGGSAMAVRTDVVEELRADVASECSEGCPSARSEHTSCTAEPACIHGLCRLVGGVPPPPESPIEESTGGEDPSVPSGY